MSEARHRLPSHFILPDLFEDWPFNVDPNPHQQAVEDSDKWFGAFNLVSPEAQKGSKTGLLCTLFYPKATAKHLRIACDMMNLFYAFEVVTDHMSSAEVRQQAQMVMDALRNHSVVPEMGESALGALARSFWKSALPLASRSFAERFVNRFDAYTQAVIQEAVDREEGSNRVIEESTSLRHQASGTYPSIDMIFMDREIPTEYIEHPTISKMEFYTVSMVCIGNDLYSWDKEHSSGTDSNNLVTLIMHEKNVPLQEAVNRVGDIYSDIRSKFLAEYANLPSVDSSPESLLKEYCSSLGILVFANHKWSHLSHRYFGRKGVEILKTRRVELSPVRLHQTLLLEETA